MRDWIRSLQLGNSKFAARRLGIRSCGTGFEVRSSAWDWNSKFTARRLGIRSSRCWRSKFATRRDRVADRVADRGVAGEFQTSNSEGGWKFEVRSWRCGWRFELRIVARLEIRSLRRGFPSTRLGPYAAEDSRSQDSPVGMSGPFALR